ncbi:MAG: phosphoglucosamine mutase, partial [Planctomycetaceae bacterium]|nr:phosphoglucosamine mutase [Planctomycetaceae bacterium]
MSERILSISGLRGVIGNGLEPDYVIQFAAALGTMNGGGTIVLARDGRSTGPMVKHAVLAGLLASGCRVIDAGIASTPTCGVLVDHLKADGGLQITASHNPAQWNGLKPFSPAGGIFNAEQGSRLIEILDTDGIEYVG